MIILIRYLLVALVLVAQGCASTGKTTDTATRSASGGEYPRDIEDLDDVNFPVEIAGFRRSKAIAYASDMADFSVSYELDEPDLQVRSSIYLYKRKLYAPTLEKQFRMEEHGVRQYYSRTTLILEDTIAVWKKGEQYQARRAAFKFTSDLFGSSQALYSELFVWVVGERYVKMRTTTPYRMRQAVEARRTALLDGINWTIDP